MLTISDAPARAYITWGQWVAECPQPWCNGGDYYGIGPSSGRIGGLGDRLYRCPRCNLEAEVLWPDNADDILAVLAQRPMPENRNWLGEDLSDLVAENVMHGISPPGLTPGGTIQLADRFADRTALAGATLRAIGG